MNRKQHSRNVRATIVCTVIKKDGDFFSPNNKNKKKKSYKQRVVVISEALN